MILIDQFQESESTQDLSGLVERLQKVGSDLESTGAYNKEAKVRKILTGLGFTEDMQNQSSRSLSGGWRVRVSLARALFIEPRLLLLDEPTNHLDLDAVLWLEDYLSAHWTGTLLVVSHDADFLDCVCTHILHVDMAKINSYSGGYSRFVEMKSQIIGSKVEQYKLQQKTLSEFKSSGLNEEKAIKRTVEKLGVDPEVGLYESPPKEYRVKFSFKDADDSLPSISVLDASFGYERGVQAKVHPELTQLNPSLTQHNPNCSQGLLFKDLRFNIGSLDKVAIVGPNGAGKSTLLSLLTGRLAPSSGEVNLHRNLRIGVYNQHFEDLLPLSESSLCYLRREYGVTEEEARKYLGMFGLDGSRHLIKIGDLSGGQKARVVFASLALKKPHILILDEPTNNLDLESVEALIEALSKFKGGVVVVTQNHHNTTRSGPNSTRNVSPLGQS